MNALLEKSIAYPESVMDFEDMKQEGLGNQYITFCVFCGGLFEFNDLTYQCCSECGERGV